ncbi:MAG TPA: GPW/gp25 family protein [Terracidiphilus sp.]|jgi:phage baseplate assembly protein W
MGGDWTKDEAFLGRGWSFPPAFDRGDAGVVMVTAEDDIRESLWILLTTIPGERVMLPDYGCGIHEHVFDGIGETLYTYLRTHIEHAVLFYEPRIVLEGVEIAFRDYLDGILMITLTYSIIQTNTRNNLVIPYSLKEGTLAALPRAS